MWIVIPTENNLPLGIGLFEDGTVVLPVQYDSPDDLITDYLADPIQFNFNKDFEVWLLNISTGSSVSFWQLLAAHLDSAKTHSMATVQMDNAPNPWPTFFQHLRNLLTQLEPQYTPTTNLLPQSQGSSPKSFLVQLPLFE